MEPTRGPLQRREEQERAEDARAPRAEGWLLFLVTALGLPEPTARGGARALRVAGWLLILLGSLGLAAGMLPTDLPGVGDMSPVDLVEAAGMLIVGIVLLIGTAGARPRKRRVS